MAEEFFKSGYLALPEHPTVCGIPALEWDDLLTNRIMIVVSVVLWLSFMMEYIRFAPTVVYCIQRVRGSINLEHSLNMARTRNTLALVEVIPFCLVIDYIGLAKKSFIPELWSAPATVALLLAYLLVRFITFKLCSPEKSLPADTALAAHRVIYTVFMVLTFILLITLTLLSVSGANKGIVKQVISTEIAIFYAFSFIRAGQILATHCSGISTILYLCGLEIVPTGLLVAGVLYF